MLPEEMQFIGEKIDVKDEPLFLLSEDDKVGWIFLVIDRF